MYFFYIGSGTDGDIIQSNDDPHLLLYEENFYQSDFHMNMPYDIGCAGIFEHVVSQHQNMGFR